MTFNEADEIDRASAIETAEREAVIAQSCAALNREGLAECEDCGEPIPEARRRALPSARRCVGCQGAAERPRNRRA